MALCCLRRPFITIRPDKCVLLRVCACVYVRICIILTKRKRSAKCTLCCVIASVTLGLRQTPWIFFYTLKHKRTQMSKAKRFGPGSQRWLCCAQTFFATSLIGVTQSGLHRRFCPLRFQAAHTRSLDLLFF